VALYRVQNTSRTVIFSVSFSGRLQNCEKRLLASSCLTSVRLSIRPALIERIFMEISYEDFSKICPENSSLIKI